jgi:hypothetical protein
VWCVRCVSILKMDYHTMATGTHTHNCYLYNPHLYLYLYHHARPDDPFLTSSHPIPFHPSSPLTHSPPSHLGVLRRTIHIDLGLGSSFSTLLISACTQNCPRCRPPTGMRMYRRLGCLFGLGGRCACTCAVVGEQS